MAALLCCAGEAAWSGDWQGQELRDVIEALRQDGLSVLYSSGLIQSGMPVRTEPAGDTVIARLEAALEPWGLGLRAGPYGSVLIVRRPVPENRRGSSAKVVPAHASVMPELVVTTSRYTMLREPVAPAAVMPNTDVERLPDLGDDPLRAVARLPGTAINGLSAKTNIRGGGADETLVVFDDLRLFNPFHLKDFQSVFSSIDPAVIDGLDIYTGAFPTNYGDRLSGVLDIQALEPPGGSYRALSLSLFSAAGLFAGDWNDGRGTWLVSARRGNLDIMLDLAGQDMGKPRYSDVHGQLGWEFSEAFRLSANALVFDDDIEIHDSDQEERATATYHDSYLWLRADNRLGSALDGYTLLSWASLRSRREGTAEQPGISVGSLADHRSADIIGLATSWSLALAGRQRLDFGAELRHSRGRYAYNDQVSFDLLFDTPGAPTEAMRTRDISLAPDGDYYAGYINARTDLSARWTTELGLRWERSTLASSSGRLSPRASLLWQVSDATQLRASWGRYWQTQGVDELPASDGETAFARPERADQFVLGMEQQLGGGKSLRMEAYVKNYANPRDRYENLLNTFVLLPELKPDRIRVAADAARARGVELSLRGGDGEHLDWWGSYSWAEARDEVAGRKYRRSWDQSHAIGAGLLWSRNNWDLSAAMTWRTGWPTTDAAIDEDVPDLVVTGPRNAARLGNYATLDLRAARRFQTSAGLVSVFLELANVLNRNNDCCMEYGLDLGDTDEFELESQDSLPILPSVGITWQF